MKKILLILLGMFLVAGLVYAGTTYIASEKKVSASDYASLEKMRLLDYTISPINCTLKQCEPIIMRNSEGFIVNAFVPNPSEDVKKIQSQVNVWETKTLRSLIDESTITKDGELRINSDGKAVRVVTK